MKTLGLFLTSLVCIGSAASEHWPQFRGPLGSGISDAKDLPLTWSETNSVKWKTPIHGRAWSSPVIMKEQIWLTTATEDGRELFAVCADIETGKIVHDIKLFDVEKPQFAHQFNTYASPTPVVEGGRVYVTFGSAGTAALDRKTGKVLWQRRDIECNHFRGAGSSPIVVGQLLVMNFDGSDYQFVIALDKSTGKTFWRTERGIDYKDLGPDGKPEAEGDWRKGFSTPHVAFLGGRPTLLSIGAKAFYGYDVNSGKELWRVEERTSHSASTRPVVGRDIIYYPTGFSKGQLLAIRPGLPGEVIDANTPPPQTSTNQLKLVWKTKRSVPNKPSILLVNDLIFMIDDGGFASCLEAATGKEIWQERVEGAYSASPVYADGRIYAFSEQGKTTVLAASREFKVLGQSQLDDGFMASPAIAGKAFYLRTKTHLYRIEN